MMKKICSFLLLIGTFFCIEAQECPPEWLEYTSGGYLSEIQCDYKNNSKSETELKNYLIDIARTNLAKQIQVHVQDIAKLKKTAVDGKSTINYHSLSQFSTDVELNLVETRSLYNPETKQYYAIAFINKNVASQYYQNEISMFLVKVDNTRTIIKNYIETGFKNRAKKELETLLPKFNEIDKSFFFLGIFDQSQVAVQLQSQCNEMEISIKQILAELQYGTAIYISCTTNIFGARNNSLQNELKGLLAEDGCNFVDTPSDADWIICIDTSAREHNKVTMNGVTMYFSYVDTNISIDKNATSQRIYEDQ